MTRDLTALEGRTFDVVILGAGIAGAAAAWDAAQRGLSVALVEANDLGGGTSWNSLKTIHGGLRHLQRLDLAGLRESVRERRALLRIAPSLVRPLSFVVPAAGHGRRGRAAFRLALAAYRLLSLDRNRGVPPERRLAPGRLLDAPALAALVPGLDATGLRGGLMWQDAQVERPEALLLGFVRAAAGQGAVVANYAEAVTLVREGQRVIGAHVRDAVGGRSLVVRGRVVLAALGAGLDALLERSGLTPRREPWQSAINVVLSRRAPSAVALGGEAGGRHLFLVPWRGVAMIGTDYAPPEAPVGERIPALMADASRAFPFFPCRSDDITLVHRGFVPGRHAGALETRDRLESDISGAAGLICARAAKYTTARALAERAIDRVVQELGRPPVRCRTAETPLPLPGDDASLEDRVRRAVHDEMAVHLADVVLRRLDLGTAGPPAEDDLRRVAGVMARELGWDGARSRAEQAGLEERYAWGPPAVPAAAQ